MADEFEGRLARLRELLAGRALDGALVWARSFYDRPGPIAYLTGFLPPFPSSADAPGVVGLGQAALLVPRRGRAVLFVDPISAVPPDAPAEVVKTGDMVAAVGERLRDLGEGARVGVAGEDIVPHRIIRLLCDALPQLTLVPVDDDLMHMRRRKSEREIAGLRRAADVARAGFEAAASAMGVGVRERDVAAAGTAACLRAGADFIRYVRVHAGVASAGGSRWPPATDAPIADGDLVTVDLIGAVDGYAFDLLRTAIVGHASDAARGLAEDAYRVHKAARAALRPGGTVAELVDAVRSAAAATASRDGLGAFYGHGIGRETLEWPYLIPGQEATFAAGEVVCLEPGLSLAGFGGACLEDELVVRPDGPELLSPFLQEPILVP